MKSSAELIKMDLQTDARERRESASSMIETLNGMLENLDIRQAITELGKGTENKDGKIQISNGRWARIELLGNDYTRIKVSGDEKYGNDAVDLVLGPIEGFDGKKFEMKMMIFSTLPETAESETRLLITHEKSKKIGNEEPVDGYYLSEEFSKGAAVSLERLFTKVLVRYLDAVSSPEEARARDIQQRKEEIRARLESILRGE